MRREPSLRTGLLLRVGAGFLALLCLDGLACYYTARHFAAAVYDRWLVDSTESLARAVHTEADVVRFAMQDDALAVFRFDAVDRTYFRITSARQGFIGGDAGLPALAPGPPGVPVLADGRANGQALRVVALLLPLAGDQVTIQVAETLRKRASLMREILVAMVMPQAMLLGVALAYAWQSVARGLRPLTQLAATLAARDHDNLEPVATAGLPVEAGVLVLQLNELLARVAAVVANQQRFVANAAHQLRTPLAAILVHSDRALRGADAPTRDAALRDVQGSVRRASRVTQQLLSLAHAEPGSGAQAQFRPLDLAGLARQVGAEWVPVALDRGLDFGLAVPDQAVMVTGHEGLLAELLANLIDNAMRYGRERGSVTVSVARQANGAPLLAVDDNGPGIPREFRERVFERFFRMSAQEGEGCGLGLAIVGEIARLHGAQARVDEPPGGLGTRLAILFP